MQNQLLEPEVLSFVARDSQTGRAATHLLWAKPIKNLFESGICWRLDVMEYHEYHQHIVEASPSINVEAEPELFSTRGVFASSQMKSQMTGEIFTNPPSQATFSSIFQAWYVRICFDITIETMYT